MKNNRSLQNKFLMLVFGITMVLFAVIFMIFSVFAFKNERQKYAERANQRMESISYNVNMILNSALARSDSISKSILLQEVLMSSKSDSEFLEEYMFLKKFFGGYLDYENYIDGQYVIYTINSEIPDNTYIENIAELEKKEIWKNLQYIKRNEAVWDFCDDGSRPYLSVFRRIDYGERCLGYLEIKTPLSQIAGAMNSVESEKAEYAELTDKSGTVIYKTQKSGGDASKKIFFRKNAVGGYKIILYSSYKEIYRECFSYIFIFLLLMVVLLIICYFIYYFLIKRLSYPFNEFIKAMENDESMLLNPELIDVDGDKDVLKIIAKFKNMAQKINKMHKDIEAINMEKKRVEISALESSINPHLLYNSLSVLKWRLSETGDRDMMNLIDYMVEYYRGVLSGGNSIITVDEEIRLASQYVKIVKIAYDREFEFKVSVSEEAGECFVLKQLLQPIVENAVMHGLKSKENPVLELEAAKEENKIIFRVSDNGYGMDEELIKQILSGDFENMKRGHSGYGFKNIIKRIKTYYGDGGEIKIKSSPGAGTCVIMTVECLVEKTIKNIV